VLPPRWIANLRAERKARLVQARDPTIGLAVDRGTAGGCRPVNWARSRHLNSSLCSSLVTSPVLRTGLHLDLDPVESSITKSCSASEDPRSVDVRFDSRSRGLSAQHVMSLLDVVALLDQHPEGAIQHRQFGEAGQP
jgi:hypothetical protein